MAETAPTVWSGPDALHTLLVPIDTLLELPGNPRRGDVDAVVRSYERFGQRKPIVVRAADRTVTAGNHQLLAARRIGWTHIAAVVTDDDEQTAAAFALADNRTHDLGTYDDELLAALLATVQPDSALFAATGYTDADLAALLATADEPAALTDINDVPDLPPDPVSRPGDVWLLGPHRLVCGNSGAIDTMNLAAGTATMDAMWTDPPYGVSYVGGTKDHLSIENDGRDDAVRVAVDGMAAALHVLRPGAPVYVAHSDVIRVGLELGMRDLGYLLRQNLIWVKNSLVLSRADYHYRHEPVLLAEAGVVTPEPEDEPLQHAPIAYGFTPGGTGRLGRGGPHWHGDNRQTTVFEIPKPQASREHPTMKPVELIIQQLQNSTERGDHVIDPFAGSSSTLIAAHHLGLTAHLIELDPRFVDVGARRYQQHTGVVPVLERTGEPHDFGTAMARS